MCVVVVVHGYQKVGMGSDDFWVGVTEMKTRSSLEHLNYINKYKQEFVMLKIIMVKKASIFLLIS